MGRKLGGGSLVIKAVFVLAENDFKKSFYMKLCVWLRMENRVFRKIIYFDRKIAPLTRKIFSASVLPSNHFRRHAKRERERERERTHRRANRERKREIGPSSLRSHWSDHHPRPLHATVRSRHEPTNWSTHLVHRWDCATNRSTHPSSSPTNPRTDRANLVILIFLLFLFLFLVLFICFNYLQ